MRSEALKAMSWPSRCGAIVIPANGEPRTVNCAETPAEPTGRSTGEQRKEGKKKGRSDLGRGYIYLVASLCHCTLDGRD